MLHTDAATALSEGGAAKPVAALRGWVSPRERASATEFSAPRMCLMSVVNSEMKESYLATRGVELSPGRDMACVSGLWSVST